MIIPRSIQCAIVLHVLSAPVAAVGQAVTTEPQDEWQTHGTIAHSESAISRDIWDTRIRQARARADQARRDWKNRIHSVPSLPTIEELASQRVIADETLMPGDIVATNRGLFVYRGKSPTGGDSSEFAPVILPDRR